MVFPRAGVRAELRAEREKVAAREQEQRELEESLDVVRTELSRTEQARKDASIKVGPLPGSDPSFITSEYTKSSWKVRRRDSLLDGFEETSVDPK